MSEFTGYAIAEERREELARTSTPAKFAMMGELPERVDPRKHKKAGLGFLKVENQGSIGSCQGNALTECGEYCYMIATGLVIQFSRMFAYLISQMYDRIKGDRGSTLDGGSKCASEVGFLLESEGPYPSKYPGWGWVTDKMKRSAARFKLKTHTIIRVEQKVRAFIGSGIGIVEIGIPWNGSCEPDKDGCITRWRGGRGGGHAVVLCGYVPDSDVGRKSSKGYWYLLKNSWSRRWGINGYAYVDPACVESMLGDRITVFVGRSDMETPEPRPIPVDFTKPGNSMYA